MTVYGSYCRSRAYGRSRPVSTVPRAYGPGSGSLMASVGRRKRASELYGAFPSGENISVEKPHLPLAAALVGTVLQPMADDQVARQLAPGNGDSRAHGPPQKHILPRTS